MIYKWSAYMYIYYLLILNLFLKGMIIEYENMSFI